MANKWKMATIILVILLITSINQCTHYKNSALKIADAINDTITYYNNNIGSITASVKTLQLRDQQMKKILSQKDNEFEKLSNRFIKIKWAVKYKSVLKIDTIAIRYSDTINCIFKKTGKMQNQWYSLSYTSDHKGLEIDSLRILNHSTAITGIKRKWFLGKEIIATDITNSNPYMSVKEIKSLEITHPVPWYKKWYVWLSGGLLGGMLLSH